MNKEPEKSIEHAEFEELSALANSGELTAAEQIKLNNHLRTCKECREVHRQFSVLTREGMPILAALYCKPDEHQGCDLTAIREQLMARIGTANRESSIKSPVQEAISRSAARKFRDAENQKPHLPWSHMGRHAVVYAGLAACLAVAVGLLVYQSSDHALSMAKLRDATLARRFDRLAVEKKAADELLNARTRQLSQLEAKSSKERQELAELRGKVEALNDMAYQLAAARTTTDGKWQEALQQREGLSKLLRESQEAYQHTQTEFAALQAENLTASQRATSLASRLDELTVLTLDQKRRLDLNEQLLASDRDIRELMGARKLYIADVFDVASDGLTRKPYGRVFYTTGKSLLFYAFDLDRQRGIKDASAFQVWGERESARGNGKPPLNLGILYLDDEANRRWFLRVDDPRDLADIESVFVTVEPPGGSNKPTAKRFLYALLRKEVNHP